MAGFLDSVKTAIKAAYCSEVSKSPEWFGNLRRIVVPDGLANAADAFNRSVCNSDDSAQDFLPAPPFFGGQCQGQRYQITLSGLLNNLQPTTFNPILSGRIIGIDTSRVNSGGFFTPVVVHNGGASEFGIITTASEQVRDSYSISNVRCVNELNQVITCPQDCGNPPSEFPDPGPIPVNPPDITYDDDDGNPITVPIGIIFAPVVIRANGTVTIPISVDVGGVKFTGNFNLFPNAEINLFPDAVINRPGTPDNPDLTNPETGTDGDPGQDEPEPGIDPIVAVVVRSNKTGYTRPSEVFQDDLPTLFAPRLGNVSFFTTTGGIASWTPFQPIQATNQHIPCPDPYGAVDVQVWWDTGWTGSYSAIRGKPLGEGV